MFKTPEEFKPAEITNETIQAVQDYLIQKNDLLYIDVYSNNGERLIDPNPELSNQTTLQKDEKDRTSYLVTTDGTTKLPLINKISIEGLTIRQAELAIQTEYEKFFKDPFVMMEFVNKRAILLGATGGQVIPLTNQNMRLTEVLALGKGLDNNSKAHNIRLLRGNEVFIIDLSTVEGYRAGNMLIRPEDIIYVEPIRRPFSEGLQQNAGIFSVVLSLASLVVVIISLK